MAIGRDSTGDAYMLKTLPTRATAVLEGIRAEGAQPNSRQMP